MLNMVVENFNLFGQMRKRKASSNVNHTTQMYSITSKSNFKSLVSRTVSNERPMMSAMDNTCNEYENMA